MGIPKKALRKSQLEEITAGSAVKSAHQITRVKFVEKGLTKNGFYKPIDSEHHYPELLALMSVATSVFKRSFQGNSAAEERLVFDDHDKLIGTLSIAIDGFKPLSCAEDPEPSDLKAKEYAIPSTDLLLAKNFIEVLFSRQYLDDDDTHPLNVGFSFKDDTAADIDYDMFWYWFTIYMKEPRPIVGVPKKQMHFTKEDWECWPRIKSAKPFHWPTYDYPGQETIPIVMPAQSTILATALPKRYPNPLQFQQLAGRAEAHEQKLAAALKILITYQPEVMRARLMELFGDMPLNYTSLGTTLSAKYETEFPALCNFDTNTKPFVDFIMGLYQKHYNALYRVAVFYQGCDNNGYGIPLTSTYQSLYEKPSFFQKIVTWVKKINGSLFKDAEDEVTLKEADLQKRYHQVWRDAFAPSFNTILNNSFKLVNDLIEEDASGSMEHSFIFITPPLEKKPLDETVTKAWQIFGAFPSLPKEIISTISERSLGSESKLRAGLLEVVDFTDKLHALTKAYYEKECDTLSESDNETFVRGLNSLYTEYTRRIRGNLANTSTHANSFTSISRELEKLAKLADFSLHLITTDEEMKKESRGLVIKELLPHTHHSITEEFNTALFNWAKNARSDELTIAIKEIIDTYYAPYWERVSLRGRTSAVKAYLDTSKDEEGDRRLAYILSSGKADGALNTLLVQHLAPKVLLPHPIPSIEKAMKSEAFVSDINYFVSKAVLTSQTYMHFYHKDGLKLFYEALFEWVNNLNPVDFKALLDSALTEYEKGLWFASSSRRAEVNTYRKAYSPAKALAMVLSNGKDTSTLNDILFNKIIENIQAEIKMDKTKILKDGFRLIAQYSSEQHSEMCLLNRENYSKKATQLYTTARVTTGATY